MTIGNDQAVLLEHVGDVTMSHGKKTHRLLHRVADLAAKQTLLRNKLIFLWSKLAISRFVLFFIIIIVFISIIFLSEFHHRLTGFFFKFLLFCLFLLLLCFCHFLFMKLTFQVLIQGLLRREGLAANIAVQFFNNFLLISQ